MKALGDLVGRIGLLWLDKRPLSKDSRRARRIRKGKCVCEAELADDYCPIHGTKQLPPDEDRPMTIDLGTRTSTNTVVGTGIVGSIAVQLIQLLPYPELVAALTTPEAVILWGSVIAWVVARVSKTPDNPGKL